MMRLGAALLAALCAGAALAQQGAAQPLSLREAVELALKRNVNVVLARTQLDASRGSAQQASGQFDPALNSQIGAARGVRPLSDAERLPQPDGRDFRNQVSDSNEVSAGVSQQFMGGVQTSVNVVHRSTHDNLTSAPRQNAGSIQLQLKLPVLRNSGDAVSAPLRAAESEVDATRSELEFATSQAVLGTTLAYWDYSAKTERVEIARASERRAGELLEELQKLIAADQLPPAEANLARASLNDRRAARLAAEQASLEARRAFGRQLGLDALEARSVGAPSDPIPSYDGRPISVAEEVPGLVRRALDTRGDIAGQRSRERAARIRFDGAAANELPQLEIVLGASQLGLHESSTQWDVSRSLSNRTYGPGYSAQIIYSIPLGNNAARGATGQARAQLDGIFARLRELVSGVPGSIETAAQAVLSAAAQLGEAEAAVKTYAISLDNERTKRRLGTTTLIDVVNLEERYTNALLAAIQARQAWANALAQFAFEADLLLSREGEHYRVQLQPLFEHAPY